MLTQAAICQREMERVANSLRYAMALFTRIEVIGGRSSSPPTRDTSLLRKSSLSVIEVFTISTSGNWLTPSASSLVRFSFTIRTGVLAKALLFLIPSIRPGSASCIMKRAALLPSLMSEGEETVCTFPKSFSFSRALGKAPKE